MKNFLFTMRCSFKCCNLFVFFRWNLSLLFFICENKTRRSQNKKKDFKEYKKALKMTMTTINDKAKKRIKSCEDDAQKQREREKK